MSSIVATSSWSESFAIEDFDSPLAGSCFDYLAGVNDTNIFP